MAYYVFTKNSDNVEGTIYRVAENQSDFNKLNILPELYKVIEDNTTNFDLVKIGSIYPIKYVNNVITFLNIDPLPTTPNENYLKNNIVSKINHINNFLESNPLHPLYQRWKDYYNQLQVLNTISNTLVYPINKSLELYFKDNSQPYYSILQVP